MQRANSERLADDMRMHPDVHDAAGDRALAVEPVELLPEHIESAIDVLALPHEHGEVVDLRGVGNRDDFLSGARLDQIGLIVVEQVGGEDQAFLGEMSIVFSVQRSELDSQPFAGLPQTS